MVELSRFDGIPHLLGPGRDQAGAHHRRAALVHTRNGPPLQTLGSGRRQRHHTMYNEAELAKGNPAQTLPYHGHSRLMKSAT